jgi:hypothetical protein
MNSEWAVSGDYCVEIWFKIEKDESGYPISKTWEQLLARPLKARNDYFEIESIPFFLKNVSRADIIQARTGRNAAIGAGEFFFFERVVEHSGHATYRLLLKQTSLGDPSLTVRELEGRGLAVEERQDGFLAVDVPPGPNQRAVDEYLLSQVQAGRWEMQDGYLGALGGSPK